MNVTFAAFGPYHSLYYCMFLQIMYASALIQNSLKIFIKSLEGSYCPGNRTKYNLVKMMSVAGIDE